jgi:hypothetical protein
MVATTLKSLVLKTATVGSAKLPTPADRIGTGVPAVHMPPANFLSQGQSFRPRLSIRERVGTRQGVAAMRYMAAAAVVPTGPVGSFSGTRACRRLALRAKPATRACHPWSPSAHPRLGRDCQSPDRSDARKDRDAAWLATSARTVRLDATAAGK